MRSAVLVSNQSNAIVGSRKRIQSNQMADKKKRLRQHDDGGILQDGGFANRELVRRDDQGRSAKWKQAPWLGEVVVQET
jgi:hypothetical protein